MNLPQTPSYDGSASADLHNTALEDSAQHLKAAAGATLNDIATSAQGLVRQSAHAAQERALQLRDSGSTLIRDRPMQSVLVAAGTGAILVLLLGLLVRGVASKS